MTWAQKSGSRLAWERLRPFSLLGGGPGGFSRALSKADSVRSSQRSRLTSQSLSVRRTGPRRQRGSSWTLLGLSMLLCLVTFQTSCCSPVQTPGPRPVLPAGRPEQAADQLIRRHLATWKPDGLNYVIVRQQLFDLILSRSRWRAYALALEAAGDWK